MMNNNICLYLIFLIGCFVVGCGQQQDGKGEATIEAPKTDTLSAISDFDRLNIDGYVPAYKDSSRNAIAVNSVTYPDQFGAAETIWQGMSGQYNVTIETMPEEDGESTYQLFVNGDLKGSYVNPETDQAFGNSRHTWNQIQINTGDTVRVASSTHSNGLIPENGGFAYARGRWNSLILEKVQ
ncbi:hypothetical protein NC796_00960 [Aliifodinibius sp. S!AR15-10]|uniref:hypothetical protein n=1 Tax=Aliifodinibius sp. S!AR15-10 TaxID=2950437 RepID=UPI00286347DD|nr:hypothetical protein [Aliifodinibius sp. S!AR15-10]MDR8389685.1 hypothetical protein [Aliifodinibius sp. S!AR15-10]